MYRKYDLIKSSIIALLAVSMVLIGPASAQFASANTGIPENFDFGENYYNVYGGPDVVATLVGDNEFSGGETITLNIDLMNKGVVTGFESEEDDKDLSVLEQKLQQTEMTYESQRTTAIGIVAVLTSLDPALEVKSGPQEAGTLVSGQTTDSPVRFVVEISKDAQPGEHPLFLSLYYGYQENVQIDGDNETDLGITNMEVGLWYNVASQNHTIPLKVEEEARFEVTNVSGELYPDAESLLHVTFTNTGHLEAKDAIVRISPADPFSTTDDQAFIGDLKPGESAVAIFKINVDELAVVKDYAINSEIKYEDPDGHDQISDSIKIRTSVMTPPASNGGNTLIVTGMVAAVVIMAAFIFYRRKNNDKGLSE